METLRKANVKLNYYSFVNTLKAIAEDGDLIGFDEYSIVVTGKEIEEKEGQTKLDA